MRITRYIVFLFVLVSNSLVFAAKGEISSGVLKGQTLVKSSSKQLSLSLDKISGLTYANIVNKVVLKYNEDPRYYLTGNWNVSVKLEVLSYDQNGNNIDLPKQIELSLNGNVGSQKSTDLDVYSFKGAYSMELRVIEVIKSSNFQVLPESISLELMIEHESYYHSSTFNVANKVKCIKSDAIPNKLNFYWEGIAEEFDFEWSFWSGDLKSGSFFPSKPSDISRFDYNRVTVKNNQFTLDNTYDNGYIFYRVRSVERNAMNPEIRIEGPWSDGIYNYMAVFNLDSDKNWVSQTAFTEDGNLLVTKSYFDATLKSRQELAKLNTENLTLVTEKFYDYEGRLVIQTLPAPTKNLSSELKFLSNFSQVPNNTNLDLLSKKYYDNTTDICKITAGPLLAKTSGAGYYYSNQNQIDKNYTSYVPDANGFAYSQTVYDLEGRPTIQGGPGSTHKIGSTHEQIIYFAQPSQKQIDRLFGNEVGFVDHYSLKILKDANNQYNYSYEDLSGKVIATSLVGDAPSNVDRLDENKNPIIIQDNFNNLNHYSVKDEAYIIETDFFVQKKDVEHKFTYSLNKGIFEYLCSKTNHDCVYDLEISITDECGRAIPSGNSISNYYNSSNSKFNTTFVITNNNYSTDPMSVFFPAVGKYKIVKILRLNNAALESAISNFNASLPTDCIPTLQEISSNFYDTAPEDECVDCQDRSTRQVNNYFYAQANDQSTSDNVSSCLTTIPSTSIDCDDLLNMLKSDMSPGGQYFDNIKPSSFIQAERNNDWLQTNVDLASLSLTYKNDTGGDVVCSSWDEVYNHWNDSWANKLVTKHPEYNHFNACKDMQQSNDFDDIMRNLSSTEISNLISNECVTELKYTKNNTVITDPFISSQEIRNLINTYLSNGNHSGQQCLFKESLYYTDEQGSIQKRSNTEAWQIFVNKYHFYKKYLYDIQKQTHYLKDNFPPDMISDESGVSDGFTVRVPNMNSIFSKMKDAEGNEGKLNDLVNEFNKSKNLVVNGDFEDVPSSGKYMYLSQLGFKSEYDFYVYSDECKSISKNIDRKQFGVLRNILLSDTNCIANHFIYRLQLYNRSFTRLTNSIRYGSIFDHTYNIGKTGLEDQNISDSGHYLFVDGSDDLNKDLKVWKQNVKVQPGFKYNYEFWSRQVGTNDNNYWNKNKAILVFRISKTNGEILYESSHFDTIKIIWSKQSNISEWICPNGINEVEISIIDFCKEPMGNDFAIDDISFIKIDDVNTSSDFPDSFFIDCMCTQIKTLTDLYTSENSEGTVDDANTYIAQSINDMFKSDHITATEIATYRTNCTANPPVNPDLTSHTSIADSLCQVEVSLDCADERNSIIDQMVLEEYEKNKNEAIANFIKEYKAYCLKTVENQGALSEDFEVEYPDQQYHFTLYYYDQSGSLVRTVPPGGVNFLTGTDLDAVDKYRNDPANNSFINTTHTLVTTYEYNTLNQLVRKSVPDADADDNFTANSKGYTDYYWYDRLGRIILSQSSKQKNYTVPAYSFLTYDALGRVKKSGEIYSTKRPDEYDIAQAGFPNKSTYSPHEITTTYYDYSLSSQVNDYFGSKGQENLRSHVSAVTFDENGDDIVENASYYSYTPHGDVDTYISDRKDLALKHINQGIFKIEYDFDLITGKVRNIGYQKGTSDQFFHQYFYDKDNRLTNVYTSKDGLQWDQDAKYFYYLHGPLARTELGEQKVQGLDYAYTLQGWLKGMNSSVLNRSSDIGQDGYNLNYSNQPLHKYVASDVVGYTIGYNKNDYSSVGLNAVNFQTDLAHGANFRGSELFNGNIANVSLALMGNNFTPLDLQQSVYQYDQLHRLKSSSVYHSSTNYASATSNGELGMSLTYDPMGNILSLDRNKDKGTNNNVALDKLTYRYDWINYQNKTGLRSNRLYHVDDGVTNVTAGYGDIKDMGVFDPSDLTNVNYGYDKSGNLIKDKSEGIKEIIWTSTGKVKAIIRDENEVSAQPDLEFTYDCFGRRISKTVKPRYNDGSKCVLSSPDQWVTTYYVHDAQGNDMASYELKTYTNDVSELTLKEHYIYGASRLGSIENNNSISTSCDLAANSYGMVTIKRNNDGQNSFNEPINIKIDGLSITNPNEIYTSFDELEAAINSYKSKVDYVAYKDPSDPLNKLIIRAVVYGGSSFDGPIRNISVTGNVAIDKFFEEGNFVSCESKRVRGIKLYEVSNYLGNVHAVITDRKIPIKNFNGTETVAFYQAELVQFTDYYPFGQTVKSRTSTSQIYNFAYNGMLKDDEIQGVGNSYTTEFRQYDARLGRWTALDPMMGKYPYLSPYVAFNNNPIFFTDPFGDDPPEGFQKHQGRGGDLYLPQSAEIKTSITKTCDQNGCENSNTNIDGFTIGGKEFNARYNSDGTFQNYVHIDGINTIEYSNPDITLASGGIIGSNLDVSFNITGVPADGLQLIQTNEQTGYPAPYQNTSIAGVPYDSNGMLEGAYTFTEGGKSMYGEVDGAANSTYALTIDSETRKPYGESFPGKPYYYSAAEVSAKSTWNATRGSGSIRIEDSPNSQNFAETARWTSIIVAMNYMGTGKDVVLGTFRWGWTGTGTSPIHSGIKLNGNTPNTNEYNIINYSYPTFHFYK